MSLKTPSLAGLVELGLLQRLLSNLEHRGARLALHLHLQGHVRDRGAPKQAAGHLHGVRHFVHLPRVPSLRRLPLLLPCDAAALRRDRPHSGVRAKISRERVPMVLPVPGQRRAHQLILYGAFREDQLPSGPRRLLGSRVTADLDLYLPVAGRVRSKANERRR